MFSHSVRSSACDAAHCSAPFSCWIGRWALTFAISALALFACLNAEAAEAARASFPAQGGGSTGQASSGLHQALVVDVQRVLRESLAAQDAQKQLDTQRARFQTETEGEENELRHAEQGLTKSRDRLDARTYAEREKQLRQRFLTVERHVEARRKALDATFTESMNTVRAALVEVVESVAKSRGAQVVIAKQQILWMDPSLDVTNEVLAKLNSKLAHVPVDMDVNDEHLSESLPLQNRSMPSLLRQP